MGKADELTHAEIMSVLAHYVVDTWDAMGEDGRKQILDISPRLANQLDSLARRGDWSQ